jgi:hypothetical protein
MTLTAVACVVRNRYCPFCKKMHDVEVHLISARREIDLKTPEWVNSGYIYVVDAKYMEVCKGRTHIIHMRDYFKSATDADEALSRVRIANGAR